MSILPHNMHAGVFMSLSLKYTYVPHTTPFAKKLIIL